MPSPFPGMDPYLEQRKLWVDFHNRLADEIGAQLNTQIRPNYFARLTPYVTYDTIEIGKSKLRGVRPDVGVMQTQPSMGYGQPSVALLEPDESVESAVLLEDRMELLSVEIYDTDDELLVTAIEILSPVNKRPKHKAYLDYLNKRVEILRSSAHLLEIDFLRAGERPPLEIPVPQAPYYIMLSRMERRPNVQVWPIQLASPLPTVPVPLYQPDPDATLELGDVMSNVYERGAYDIQIDYTQPVPSPNLTDAEHEWVATLLKSVRE
ncbi:MAG: DUF4058 family protein [Chloroflexota bacterium]